jgi:hypothetical protein
MPTFKGGAFIQQCFASHPLSLNFKALTPPDTMLVNCTACDMRHRLIVRPGASPASEELTACVRAHAGRLRVSAVDVMVDSVQFRCADCRRSYQIEVARFETYRKDI